MERPIKRLACHDFGENIDCQFVRARCRRGRGGWYRPLSGGRQVFLEPETSPWIVQVLSGIWTAFIDYSKAEFNRLCSQMRN